MGLLRNNHFCGGEAASKMVEPWFPLLASFGNRTRGSRLEGEYFTTKLMMLFCIGQIYIIYSINFIFCGDGYCGGFAAVLKVNV